MSTELPFDPLPFIDDPHQQTVISSFFHILLEPESKQKIIQLPDGDRLCLEITTPKDWKPTSPTVLMVHGLCGSHRSPYLVRLVKRLEPNGIRSVRLNLRGCGSGKGLSRYMYHAGRSEDVFEAIKQIKLETPESPILLIGFSLGGNIVLKLVGELGSLGKQFLSAVIAVSPPADLYSSVVMLGHPDNAMYERYFISLMRSDVIYRHGKFKDLAAVSLPKQLKLYEFDQIYTAPNYGFRDARDYYSKCSAAQYAADISVPCRVLLSEDDPIVSHKALDDDRRIFSATHLPFSSV